MIESAALRRNAAARYCLPPATIWFRVREPGLVLSPAMPVYPSGRTGPGTAGTASGRAARFLRGLVKCGARRMAGVLAALAYGLAAVPAAAWPATDPEPSLRQLLSTAPGELVVDGIVLHSPASVRTFYASRNYAPAWIRDGRLGARARQLHSVVDAAAGHGLAPGFYHAPFIDRIAARTRAPGDAANATAVELLFTDALLTLGADLLFSRARRVALDEPVIDAAEALDVNAVAQQALAAGELGHFVERLAPRPAAYRRLRDALVRLRARGADPGGFDIPARILRPGDRDPAVSVLRQRLVTLGDLENPGDGDGRVFNPRLVAAVKRFQARHGLDIDGIVGRQTRAALAIPTAVRIARIELNLDRWRRLPRDPGMRYLLVNIAAQVLTVMENQRPSLAMRVVVGRPRHATPSIASRIETIVLNPYWNLPHSIAVNETLPKLRADPDYLGRENIEVLKRGDGGGRPIDPASIDWDQVPVRGFPYRFRQAPGPNNALGRIKFLMPNPYSVLLHDTPATALFRRFRRCFSHGCVRLQEPFALADLLLYDEPGWSSERVAKTLATEQNHWIRLTRPMPIYLVYWTAWVDPRGIMQFRDDIYGRDARLAAALDS